MSKEKENCPHIKIVNGKRMCDYPTEAEGARCGFRANEIDLCEGYLASKVTQDFERSDNRGMKGGRMET